MLKYYLYLELGISLVAFNLFRNSMSGADLGIALTGRGVFIISHKNRINLFNFSTFQLILDNLASGNFWANFWFFKNYYSKCDFSRSKTIALNCINSWEWGVGMSDPPMYIHSPSKCLCSFFLNISYETYLAVLQLRWWFTLNVFLWILHMIQVSFDHLNTNQV